MSTKLNSSFEPTRKELRQLKAALDNAEFRRHLVDYVSETSSAEAVAAYEADVAAVERQHGFEVTFLHPQPGFVLKTANLRSDEKVFLNVCSDPAVARAEATEATGGLHFAIPYSQSPSPRKDVDKSGRPCTVYDVIFHPETLAMADESARMKAVITETALDAVEKAFAAVKLQRDNIKCPKLKYKGAFQPTVIRKPLGDKKGSESVAAEATSSGEKPTKNLARCPTHVIKYRHRVDEMESCRTGRDASVVRDVCRPTEIVVEVHLPEIDSAQTVDLDVTELKMTLRSDEPVAYALDVDFSYPVIEEKGTAKFDKAEHKLTVVVPVKAEPEVQRLVSTDSGIEIDMEDEVETKSQVATTATATSESDCAFDDDDLMFPPYSCNIYEDLMIFTVSVKNVNASSVAKFAMTEENFGFGLKFQSVGSGFVPFRYGFYCTLVMSDSTNVDPLNCLDVEVWDNNIIIKIALPKYLECCKYKVGSNPRDLTIHELPQLRAIRKKKERFSTKDAKDEGDDDAFLAADCDKERHSSGDSEDSALSSSPPASIAASSVVVVESGDCASNDKPRSILKRRQHRCFSESQAEHLGATWEAASCDSSVIEEEDADATSVGSKKSVRFNEVVQRNIFRPNSSILGQKQKNVKKNEQKRRSAARRASESDAHTAPASFDGDTPTTKATTASEYHSDSGLASSTEDEALSKEAGSKQKKSSAHKKKAKKQQPKQMQAAGKRLLSAATSDLIFDLDIE